MKNIAPIIEKYTTPKGEECECHMFVAIDAGTSTNTSTDTHKLVWTNIHEVEHKLSYEGLKTSWNQILPKILKLF